MHKAILLMTADLRREFSLDELAQSLSLSTSRLRHLFTAEVGLSPMQYLKAQRMQSAKELLETTFFNVRQIMRRVGITDESHFVRDFQRRYGLSPAQYRAQHLAAASQQEIKVKVARSANE